MENNLQPQQKVTKHEIILTKNTGGGKKGLKVILIVVGALAALLLIFGVFVWMQMTRMHNRDYCFVVAPEVAIVEKGEEGSFTQAGKAVYGEKFLLGEGSSKSGKKYMEIKGFSEGHALAENKRKEYFLLLDNDDDVTSEYHYDDYSNIFTSKETQNLPAYIKKGIVQYVWDKRSSESNSLMSIVFTQNPDRLRHVIAYGDFDTDGQDDDVGVVLESGDGGGSCYQLVLCYNDDTRKAYIAYQETLYCNVTISGFRKGALIFMDSETLVKAPNDGIIQLLPSTYHNNKYAILYAPASRAFEAFTQKPKSEIEADLYDEVDYYEEMHREEDAAPDHPEEEIDETDEVI